MIGVTFQGKRSAVTGGTNLKGEILLNQLLVVLKQACLTRFLGWSNSTQIVVLAVDADLLTGLDNFIRSDF